MFISFSKNIVTAMMIALVGLSMSGCSKTAEPAEIMSIEKIAIDGYDPVAYFVSTKAYKADGTYTYSYKDLTWYFESNENLEAFSADPEAFVPRLGGFCAYELADEELVYSDPRVWYIHNRGLYLFSDEDAKEEWFRKIDVMLSASEKEWNLRINPEEDTE